MTTAAPADPTALVEPVVARSRLIAVVTVDDWRAGPPLARALAAGGVATTSAAAPLEVALAEVLLGVLEDLMAEDLLEGELGAALLVATLREEEARLEEALREPEELSTTSISTS